jgi:TonB family protein
MNTLKIAPDVTAPTIPFKVRLEPYLIESICELARFIRDKGNTQTEVSGLLFGVAENGSRVVGALKTFEAAGTRSDLARRERMEKAYAAAVEEAKEDPELGALQLVGWFSFRNGSGLLSSDVVFHNQHFRKPEDLAVVIWREGTAQITAEVYSKSGSSAMTSTDYRWSSVRLSSEIRRMSEPIDLAMRVKLTDDSFLRAYESDEPETTLESWKKMAGETANRLMSFLQVRPKDELITARVRGLIGDGRLPTTPNWEAPHSAPETAPEPAEEEDRFETTLPARRPPAEPEPSRPVAAAAAAGAVFGSPKSAGLQRIPDQRVATNLPPISVLDLGKVGQSPQRARVAQTEISGLPMLIRPQRREFAWPWAAIIFVACSAVVFGALAFAGLQAGGNGRIAQAVHSLFGGGELNLRVKTQDDRLLLSWNPQNAAVASATDGTLQIQDGPQKRDIHLDGRQVADGSVLYRPITSDVSFRLEVHGQQGSTMGSVRVLDGPQTRQTPTLDVSDPQPADPSFGQVPAQTATADPFAARYPVASDAVEVPVPAGTRKPAGSSPAVPLGSPTAALSGPPAKSLVPAGTTTINGWEATPEPVRKRPAALPGVPVPAGSSAAEFVAPQPLLQVTPSTRALANGVIQTITRVEVQVRVDQTGHVAFARVLNAANIKRAVANAALNAARQWTFLPATLRGQRVDSDHTIVFEFRPQR